MECLATLYTGYPNVVRLDQGADFTAKDFRDLATAYDISLQLSGAQSHNSIGTDEKYYEPLQRVFQILRTRHPKLEPEITLRYEIKGVENTMGAENVYHFS